MQKSLIRKGIVFVVILLFIGINNIPSTSSIVGESRFSPELTIDGPTQGVVGELLEYFLILIDPEECEFMLYLDWDDGTEGWFGPYLANEEIIKGHAWYECGVYTIQAIAECNGSHYNTTFEVTITSSKTLYVGGSGEGNYTKIQDAIDNASDGDTVFVYNGTYYENLVVDKSINLIGENRNITIIDGNENGDVAVIDNTDGVNINGFTFQNSDHYYWHSSGIKIILSDNCNISGNNINYSNKGIFIPSECKNLSIIGNYIKNCNHGVIHDIKDEKYLINCNIQNNLITDNFLSGIWLDKPVYCNITGNIIDQNGEEGIAFWYSGGHDNIVIGNIISNNKVGIQMWGFDKQSNTIIYNEISNNRIGIHLDDTKGNEIKYNNFIGNNIHNYYECSHTTPIRLRTSNSWIGNYYGGWIGLIPKPIFGLRWIYIPNFWHLGYEIPIPWFPMFDWRPALKPYDI